MTSPLTTSLTSREFFDQKYASSADPWKLASSPYELTRYATLMRALDGRRFHRAFEPGCSIGVFTSVLATVCSRVDALDISPKAVELAKTRCAKHQNITFHTGALPDAIPNGPFDLIVLSEVAYYFEVPQLRVLAARLVSELEPGGTFIAANWLGSSPEHRISGDSAHLVLREAEGLHLTHCERHDHFRLDMWTRLPKTKAATPWPIKSIQTGTGRSLLEPAG